MAKLNPGGTRGALVWTISCKESSGPDLFTNSGRSDLFGSEDYQRRHGRYLSAITVMYSATGDPVYSNKDWLERERDMDNRNVKTREWKIRSLSLPVGSDRCSLHSRNSISRKCH